jgi:hypothetical protein
MPPLDHGDHPITYFAAIRAVADLDRAIGGDRRSLARPAPGLSV